jgi:hypothetical protein
MVSLINMTARHVETETHLTPRKNNDWQTDYFVLPPLAADGLGYGVYITSAAIGAGETVNDIRHITVYPLDYEGLTATTPPSVNNQSTERVLRSVTHPNPSLYRIQLSGDGAATVILNQAYNEYWRAYDITGASVLGGIVPWLFGTEIPAHLTVNNWQNGWEIDGKTRDIAIIFLPQLLGYLGYGVFISVFLGVLLLKK